MHDFVSFDVEINRVLLCEEYIASSIDNSIWKYIHVLLVVK